jgi:hypothetical protein
MALCLTSCFIFDAYKDDPDVTAVIQPMFPGTPEAHVALMIATDGDALCLGRDTIHVGEDSLRVRDSTYIESVYIQLNASTVHSDDIGFDVSIQDGLYAELFPWKKDTSYVYTGRVRFTGRNDSLGLIAGDFELRNADDEVVRKRKTFIAKKCPEYTGL